MAWMNITGIKNYGPGFFEILVPPSQITRFVIGVLAISGGLWILSIILIVIGIMKKKNERKIHSN